MTGWARATRAGSRKSAEESGGSAKKAKNHKPNAQSSQGVGTSGHAQQDDDDDDEFDVNAEEDEDDDDEEEDEELERPIKRVRRSYNNSFQDDYASTDDQNNRGTSYPANRGRPPSPATSGSQHSARTPNLNSLASYNIAGSKVDDMMRRLKRLQQCMQTIEGKLDRINEDMRSNQQSAKSAKRNPNGGLSKHQASIANKQIKMLIKNVHSLHPYKKPTEVYTWDRWGEDWLETLVQLPDMGVAETGFTIEEKDELTGLIKNKLANKSSNEMKAWKIWKQSQINASGASGDDYADESQNVITTATSTPTSAKTDEKI